MDAQSNRLATNAMRCLCAASSMNNPVLLEPPLALCRANLEPKYCIICEILHPQNTCMRGSQQSRIQILRAQDPVSINLLQPASDSAGFDPNTHRIAICRERGRKNGAGGTSMSGVPMARTGPGEWQRASAFRHIGAASDSCPD